MRTKMTTATMTMTMGRSIEVHGLAYRHVCSYRRLRFANKAMRQIIIGLGTTTRSKNKGKITQPIESQIAM